MANKKAFAENEKQWVYRVLIFIAGFYGGYAMLVRGGAFSNAQTGNVLLCAIALGNGQWQKAAYYVIPMSAYMLGCMVSELHIRSKRNRKLSWETVLILFEIFAVAAMGFLPATAPHQICQVLINLICAMRLSTFRQSEGIPMATIFCTNHIRQLGASLAAIFRKDPDSKEKFRMLGVHGLMILSFMLGVAAATIACRFWDVKAIWLTILPLGVLFTELLKADRKEKVNI